MSAELYDSSEEVDVRLNLLEHVGDESVGETLTQDIINAAALLDSQAAELVGLREQLARQAPVIEAAERVAWDYQHADEEDAEPDLSWCPYNRRGLPGADPDGICGFGCREEPACQTSGPWPMNELEIAVRALSVPAPPEAPTVTG